MLTRHPTLAPLALLATLLGAGCMSSEPPAAPAPVAPVEEPVAAAKTFRICPGPEAQKEAIIAFFDAREGDTIEFCDGQFEFDAGLIMFGKKGITIRGAGINKTYLRFENSTDQDGLNLNQMRGITVADLTIYDAPGNGLRIFRSDDVTVSRVKVGWSNSDPATPYGNYDATMESWSSNGAYAFYPVICHRVLIEDSISVGSSDAGVYVGQSSDILVRRTEAYHNVAGFEFENTYRAEFVDNIAHDNVGGFLIFDLPGRVQFGEKNRVHRNKSFNNNIPQFAPQGAIVAYIPSGTGALVLASDQLEFHDNEIYDNNTVGLVIVNYGLADSAQSQTRYDFYPEGMHVYNNVFTNNGSMPQLPDPERSPCTGPGGLPGSGDAPDCLAGNPGLLVTIIQLKNLGKSAQIIWDGAVDTPSGCTSYPVDAAGIPLNQPNPGETVAQRYEARVDERGRPNLYQYDPEPPCQYNAWKFNEDGSLKRPQNGMCIEGNTFNKTTPLAMLVDDYANIHFATADPTAPENLALATHDMPAECPIVEPPLLSLFLPALPNYVPNPANDPRPSEAKLAAVCGAVKSGEINYEALLNYNCPRLQDYGLFADPQDPTRAPNGFGVPFDLNTVLFSDYASKYRFLFLPPDASGQVQKATYMDHEDCETLNIYNCHTATLGYPTGTVFAKTFSFKDGEQENVVETRLLIKRAARDGSPLWVGYSYLWTTNGQGQRVAELKIEGSAQAVSWNYEDPDPEARNSSGVRPRYTGSADHYVIPSAAACLLCHGGDDREPGTAPIGHKVRNLNKNHTYTDVGEMNQLAYLQMRGMLDLPRPPEQLEKMVKFNVPGSGGDAPGSAVDVHRRARAYLEVNCLHCHQGAGAAQNSGLNLNGFTEPMLQSNGICKPPIAAGKGAEAGDYDIQPGNAGVSILLNRVQSTAPGVKMPPLARSVPQAEAVDLLANWINSYVGDFSDPEANFCGSGSGTLPIPLMKVVPPTAAEKTPFG